jgi:anti-sigma factor RsiW
MNWNCKKVLSHLNAYVDGEIPRELMPGLEDHLGNCPVCREELERIHQVGEMLDRLAVAPLPQGFAARAMAEAQRKTRAAEENKSRALPWQPVRWLFDLSFAMRLATCVTIFLACFLGAYMSSELSIPRNIPSVHSESLESLEWFSPTPPSSLGSAYLSMASSESDK